MSYPGSTVTAPAGSAMAFPGGASNALVRPVTGAKLVDTWGAARSGGRRHEGIDIMAPEGSPIHAVAGGTIVQGFQNQYGGVVVRIQGDDGRFYYYAHLTPGSTDHLRVGQRVQTGQVIGGVGHTGNAQGTPDHLHFQVRENGQWVNPYTFLNPLPEVGGAAGTAFTAGATDPFAIDAGGPPSVTDADQDGLIDQFERLFGTDTTKSDTDGDGLTDAYETSVSHTDAVSIDTDRDGLTDAHELAGGTDAGRAQVSDAVRAAKFGGLATLDSDSDGVSDLQEQKAGTNALAADTDRDGLSDGFEAAKGSNPLSMDSDNDGLTDGFESASGTLEPAAQAGVPGGAALAPGGFGAEGGFAAGAAGPLGADPLGTGAPGTGMDPLDVHDH
jgi:hypothetical protein